MRAVLVLLLFQFISPIFFSVVTLVSASEEAKTIAPTHSSIIVPVFLKEQEEREHEETVDKSFELIPIVNFFNHSLTHTAAQSLIFKGYNHQAKFGCQPPLFELYGTLLI